MPFDFSHLEGTVVVIPAAGSGSRFGSKTPKQYQEIAGKAMVEVTVEKFLAMESIALVILVVAPDDDTCFHFPFADHEQVVIIDGGPHRSESVLNGLKFLLDAGLSGDSLVMVHDAARPCISESDVVKLQQAFEKDRQPKMLAARVVDTLQTIDENLIVKSVVDRESMVKALTPQCAKFYDLKESLKSAISSGDLVTDETSALIKAGFEVGVVFGRADNIKVTNKEDLALAAFILSQA